MAELWWGEQDS